MALTAGHDARQAYAPRWETDADERGVQDVERDSAHDDGVRYRRRNAHARPYPLRDSSPSLGIERMDVDRLKPNSCGDSRCVPYAVRRIPIWQIQRHSIREEHRNEGVIYGRDSPRKCGRSRCCS